MFVRPCILIVDPPVDGGISSRKLVLESAKFNVIATYSCDEALATLERFPRVHAVVLNAILHEHECASLLHDIREKYPVPVRLLVGHVERAETLDADYFVDNYSPRVLLETLHRVFPPEQEPGLGPKDIESSSVSQPSLAG